MKIPALTVSCSQCAWEYHEPLIEEIVPPALMASFSDPVRLEAIVKRQRMERIVAAIKAHESICPPREPQ